ncbi:MAG: hypothetical protein CMJ25_01510 [Phycisphaerae bacterium]|nr:hypothetical protein [Phycisphaerae bacterium]
MQTWLQVNIVKTLIMARKKSKKEYNKIGFRNKDVDRFGMLSVKAGIDNNPGITKADRIAGATMKKKK